MKRFGIAGAATRLMAAGWMILSLTSAAGTYKSITIDGSFDDWTGVPLAHEDPADSTTSADYRNIWIANDSEFLYLRFTLERPDDPFTANDNIFIDADNDAFTGYPVFLGSEMLIQSGFGYEERNGGFNEGGIEDLGWLSAGNSEGTEFEVRISRRARFASDGTDVFLSPFIAVLLEAEDANFTRQETAPDTEGIVYEFAEPPPPLSGTVSLVSLTADWRYLSGGSDPDSQWMTPEFDETQAGWASGAPLFGFTPDPGGYPLPIATALEEASVTHYFRTRFNWENDPVRVLFVVTNYLSDGARLFLNGAELRRIRLPEGDLTSTTPATGGPGTPGQPEVFALTPGALVLGENVLAVEVHQSEGTPQDLVFGLSLHASSSFPVQIVNPEEPADRGVTAGEGTTFRVEVIGTEPIEYQWLKDGTPIEDATSPILLLDPVLPEHAGRYSVRVSNPALPGGVTSREAVLTVLGTPVEIVQQPQSVTAVEGTQAEFSVVATGSAPLSYQWFHDGVAIADGTNATYTIASVSTSDAGSYRVQVFNPVTAPPVESTAVTLTVEPDEVGPRLGLVEGTPNRIVVRFSEPVDVATAENPANYLVTRSVNEVTPSLEVTAASVDTNDLSVVVLATARQTLGTRYYLSVSGVRDRFGNSIAQGASGSFVSSIRIDGSFEDWEDVPMAFEDPADAENATDYAAAWIFSDDRYVYMRVRLHQPSDLGIFYNNIFIDTDGAPETGYPFRGIGSEVLIQGGGGYQQKNGGFNEGVVSDLEWQMQPEGIAEEFELRFSLYAIFNNDLSPVFAGNTISLFLESENTSFVTVDVAPDFEPLVHELSSTRVSPLVISSSSGQVTITWSGPGRLESTTDLGAGDWQPVPDATSPYEVSPSNTARFYRLSATEE